MTVAELITKLLEQPQQATVFIDCDDPYYENDLSLVEFRPEREDKYGHRKGDNKVHLR